MTLRAIKQIEARGQKTLVFPVPRRIYDAFHFSRPATHKTARFEKLDGYVCRLGRHFNSNKALIGNINRNAILLGTSCLELNPGPITGVAEMVGFDAGPGIQEYGVAYRDYLEIFFDEVMHQEYLRGFFSRKYQLVGEDLTPIFPQKMLEDLDFNPDALRV